MHRFLQVKVGFTQVHLNTEVCEEWMDGCTRETAIGLTILYTITCYVILALIFSNALLCIQLTFIRMYMVLYVIELTVTNEKTLNLYKNVCYIHVEKCSHHKGLRVYCFNNETGAVF